MIEICTAHVLIIMHNVVSKQQLNNTHVMQCICKENCLAFKWQLKCVNKQWYK